MEKFEIYFYATAISSLLMISFLFLWVTMLINQSLPTKVCYDALIGINNGKLCCLNTNKNKCEFTYGVSSEEVEKMRNGNMPNFENDDFFKQQVIIARRG